MQVNFSYKQALSDWSLQSIKKKKRNAPLKHVQRYVTFNSDRRTLFFLYQSELFTQTSVLSISPTSIAVSIADRPKWSLFGEPVLAIAMASE